MKAFKITFTDGFNFIECGKSLEYWQNEYKTASIEAITLTIVGGRFLY